jgi:hypothetical protein
MKARLAAIDKALVSGEGDPWRLFTNRFALKGAARRKLNATHRAMGIG